MAPSVSPAAALAVILLCVAAITRLLAARRAEKISRVFLAGLLAAQLPLFVFVYAIAADRHVPGLEWLLRLQFASLFLSGPFVWAWAGERMRPSGSWRNAAMRFVPHTLAAVLVFTALVVTGEANPYRFIAFRLMAKLHIIVYLVCALAALWRHQQRLANNYADWPLGRLLLPIAAIGVYCLLCVFELVIAVEWVVPGALVNTLLTAVHGGFCVVFALLVTLSPAIAVVVDFGGKAVPEPEPAKTQRAPESSARSLIEQLDALMARDRLYLDPELSLAKLAEALQANVYLLSEVINSQYGASFYHYVNRFRVEYAKAMLADGAANQPSMKEVCYESGFNNRTSFNRAFKNLVGQTPSQYRCTPGASAVVNLQAG